MEPIWIASISAIPPTIAAVSALLVGLRNSRKVNEVHVIVNEQCTVAEQRIGQLTLALKNAGIEVPDVTPKTGLPA